MRRLDSPFVAPSSLAALALSFALLPSALAQDAAVEPLGGGTVGFGGVPRIDLDGAPIQGLPLRIGIEDGRANSIALVGASATVAPVFDPVTGITIHPSAPFFALQTFALDSEGRSGAIVDVPSLSPSLVGAEFWVQGVVFDPTANGSIAATDGVRFEVGATTAAAQEPEALFPGGRGSLGDLWVRASELADVDADGALELLLLAAARDANGIVLGDAYEVFEFNGVDGWEPGASVLIPPLGK